MDRITDRTVSIHKYNLRSGQAEFPQHEQVNSTNIETNQKKERYKS